MSNITYLFLAFINNKKDLTFFWMNFWHDIGNILIDKNILTKIFLKSRNMLKLDTKMTGMLCIEGVKEPVAVWMELDLDHDVILCSSIVKINDYLMTDNRKNTKWCFMFIQPLLFLRYISLTAKFYSEDSLQTWKQTQVFSNIKNRFNRFATDTFCTFMDVWLKVYEELCHICSIFHL